MRTKVLFAFGTHGDKCHGGSTPMDKPFFKRSVVPFLEEHVGKGGKKATIIYESTFATSIKKIFDRVYGGYEEFWRGLAALRYMTKVEGNGECAGDYETLLSLIRDLCEAHEVEVANQYQMFDKGTDAPSLIHWGFEEYMLQINKRSPGSIRSICEGQDAEAVLAVIAEMYGFGALLKSVANEPHIGFAGAFVEKVKTGAEATRRRDMVVIKQMEEIAAGDPDGVIVVPRGWGHKVMVKLIDNGRFEVTVKEKTDRSVSPPLPNVNRTIRKAQQLAEWIDEGELREMILQEMQDDQENDDRIEEMYYMGEIDEAGLREYAEGWKERKERLIADYLRSKKPPE